MLNGTRRDALLWSIPRIVFNRHASAESIAKFQDGRLRAIVRHAYDHVRYYRRLFDDAGINPGAIRSRADLHLIPITTKKALQSLSIDEIVSDDRSEERRVGTEGGV